MHSTLVALVLSIWTSLGAHGPDETRIAQAIAAAVAQESSPASGESHAVDAALLAVYAARESGLSEHPAPCSWDARAGLSAGVWQLRSYLVAGRSIEMQARTWLDSLRRGGLAQGIDSDGARATHRLELARSALRDAIATLTTSEPMLSSAP